MNATATRILYSGYTDTGQAVLAVIEVSPTSLGAAPLIKDVHVSPSTIPVDGSSSGTVTVAVAWEGTLITTELDILREEEPDFQLARDPIFLADTQGADPTRGQGIFETTGLTSTPQEGQTPGAGPRTLRILVESVAEDQEQHTTVLDVDDKLTVGAAPSAGTGALLFRLDGLPADEAAVRQIVDGARDALFARPDDEVVVLAYHVEMRLDPNATPVEQGGTGGVLDVAFSGEAVNQTALDDPAREVTSESTDLTWETTGLLPPTTTSPWFEDGVGFVQFETVTRTHVERGTSQEPGSVWTRTSQYGFALDESGSLVLCSVPPDRVNREQMRADCLAHPFLTLPRVS